MHWVWTWGGRFFGYIDGDDLWTYDGRHVAKLSGNEIYGPDGHYLGEVMQGNRLITNTSKRGSRGARYKPLRNRGAHPRYADYVGQAMYAGHEDFPGSETL